MGGGLQKGAKVQTWVEPGFDHRRNRSSVKDLGVDRILSRSEPLPMLTINYTDARNQLAGLMETASRDREPITITRNGAGKVVLLAIEEYEAMETTLHLHSTRANAAQIQQSLADYAAGKVQAGELCD